MYMTITHLGLSMYCHGRGALQATYGRPYKLTIHPLGRAQVASSISIAMPQAEMPGRDTLEMPPPSLRRSLNLSHMAANFFFLFARRLEAWKFSTTL